MSVVSLQFLPPGCSGEVLPCGQRCRLHTKTPSNLPSSCPYPSLSGSLTLMQHRSGIKLALSAPCSLHCSKNWMISKSSSKLGANFSAFFQKRGDYGTTLVGSTVLYRNKLLSVQGQGHINNLNFV